MSHRTDRVATGFVEWNYHGKAIRVGFDRFGNGPIVLLLPAFSSISTRREMLPLQERLAANFTTVAIDWPGFGDAPRPQIALAPGVYQDFLRHVLTHVVSTPFATLAAGHAASYALAAAVDAPGSTGVLCLVAPTWRGPLPTMMNGRRAPGQWIARAGDAPLFGRLLYRLNVNRAMVRMMARGHVYGDPNWLTEARLAQKMEVVKAPGARHASIRFVAGMLDLMPDRAAFLATAGRVNAPILLIYGAGTPPKSKAEMEALGSLPHVRSVKLANGKLAVHEEFPDAVAEQVTLFLGGVRGEAR
jgi:pimeloyl-ACP methyl ester carboxylesterase